MEVVGPTREAKDIRLGEGTPRTACSLRFNERDMSLGGQTPSGLGRKPSAFGCFLAWPGAAQASMLVPRYGPSPARNLRIGRFAARIIRHSAHDSQMPR